MIGAMTESKLTESTTVRRCNPDLGVKSVLCESLPASFWKPLAKLWLDAVALAPFHVSRLGRDWHRQPFSLPALSKHVAVATRLILRNSIDITKSRR